MGHGEKRRGRGLPLTFRLLFALSLGSVVLSLLVCQLAVGIERERRAEDRDAEVERFARSLAARAAPLLENRDDLRLAMLCASVAELSDCRIVTLDRTGTVRLDTGLSLGGRKLQLLTQSGSFQRQTEGGRVERLAPARGLHGMVGEVRVRYWPIGASAVSFSWMLFGGAFLASLSLLIVVGLIMHHWMMHVREVVSVASAWSRGELLERCERRAGGVIRDLQLELGGLRDALSEGHHTGHRSFLELAHRMVEQLERRGLKGHAERTCRYAMVLCQRLGLSTREARDLELAAQLHDLGEAFVRPALLQKRGPLEDAERDTLLHVPDRAADLIAGLPPLRGVADIVRHVREKFDGNGYPQGLRGDRIPLGARILALAEAYDHVTTGAADGVPLSWEVALDRLAEERGDRFDPWLFDLFEEEIRKSPVPDSEQRTVTISSQGVVPYQVEPQQDIEPSVEDEVLSWGDADFDVLGPGEESQP